MADYNINKSNGVGFVISTGGIDNTFDIPLLGQDAINYGDDLAQGQLRLLENFANGTAPAFGTTRTTGQLWYDTTVGQGLKVYDGATWDLLPLDTDVVHRTGGLAQTVTGVKTFSSSAAFTAAAVPFTVNSTTVVANLNAAQLDGNLPAAFATALQGLKADAAEVDIGNPPTDGFIYSSTTGGTRTWISPAVSTGNVNPVDTGASAVSHSVLLALTPTGDQTPRTDGQLTFTPSSNTLATTNFAGNLSGTATLATNATNAATAALATTITVADTELGSTFLVLSPSATGPVGALTDETLTYSASSGTLTTTQYIGGGVGLTGLTAANITAGVLAVARGGTGVSTATGSGSTFVLSTSPTFTTNITVPLILSTSGVAIQFNGTTELVTQSNTATGQTTGAQVRHQDTNLYDVGMNVLPQFGWDTTDTLEAQHCGMLTGHSNGAAHTLTIPASGDLDFPVGGVTTIINGSATDYTILDDATATLFYIEPGVGGTDIAGTMTIGAGGVATLYRLSAGVYYIWGSEITP